MKKVLRVVLVIATMLFLYKVMAILYGPFTIDRVDEIHVRKYAWIAGSAIAAILVFVENKLHLTTPQTEPCLRCAQRDKVVTIILIVIAVLHPLSAFIMPNVAEVFNPVFIAAAMLEEVSFLEAIIGFLNKNLFMLNGMYYLFDVFLVQQMIFAIVCYLLFGKLYCGWQAKKVHAIVC